MVVVRLVPDPLRIREPAFELYIRGGGGGSCEAAAPHSFPLAAA